MRHVTHKCYLFYYIYYVTAVVYQLLVCLALYVMRCWFRCQGAVPLSWLP